MTVRWKLVWKLSAVVVTILGAAIAVSGFASDRMCAHYSLESARAFLRFNSESIIKGIGKLMMSRNNQGIEDLIVELSQDSPVYGDIRLVAHPSGRVVASRHGGGGGTLQQEDRACAVCHNRDDLGGIEPQTVDTVIHDPGGDRILSVTAPILAEPGCRSAACHAHDTSPPLLGFLNADYSLRRVDATVDDRRILIVATAVASLLLGTAALWLMFRDLLARPISGLIAGTKRITAGQLDFRFDQKRTDEIGVLEGSFNAMTTTIQTDQDALRRDKEYLEGIVENTADLIITVTPEGRIQTFNRGAEQALGYRRDEVIGRRIEFLFADRRERDVVIVRLKDGESVKNYETRFVDKDGQARNVLLTLSRLRDGQGAPIGTLGISKDITQEKKLQRELVRSQKFAAIGQAVTGIQHAIKNMLNGLKGGAYVVRSGLARDDRQRIQEGWTMLEQSVEQISKYARNMLDYAKEWRVELQTVDLNSLVAKICTLNRQVAADRGVAIRCECADGLPSVSSDPRLIHMAVTDIVVNAIDACTWKDYHVDECAEVSVKNSLEEEGGVFVIEVRDNGCGMTEEIQRNIFTPFFSTKKSWGTGLGLALTARIIKAHGGKISVESEPDRGTTFRIHLPVAGPRDSKETDDGQAGSHSR